MKIFKISEDTVRQLSNFFRKNRGSVLIEFAVVLPLIIVLCAGVFELMMFALLNNKLTRTVGVLGDAITRDDIKRSEITSLLNTARTFLKPFEFNSAGSIVVSQVRNDGLTTDPSKMVISWQVNINGAASRLGTVGARPANMPNSLTILNDQAVVITEVFYNYQPIVFKGFYSNKRLYHVSTFVPRVGSMTSLKAE
ncbi:MAG: hypothetical protein BGO77_04235 [Caedibacter sp. 37-49]|nr:MAG: hypothetical protein BGO77_04235 [Caedibacter sp. 37-49]